MNYFIPEQDITHKRAFDIFAMKQTADGTVTDTNWRFSKATFDPDGRVDQVTRAAMDNMVFAVGRTTDLPGILWTKSERDPLRFAVRSDKVDAFRALDPEGMEFIPLGTMWDRTAETFFDTPNFCVVNVLRRADG
ncbi:hypothetical protein EDD52_1109 [Primorskyibacter sedentarius]|uniref:Uncharacterized protein n=1 Tax=Primorskyibacter sedentarius TaxID=745311 RepID=A0A4R3J9X4_9RHOB|nr:hypothetical protein [Primorskyibacter sedentarius]TCS61836.1 hypothetical protein EDD52_1109 [Primorskyibacter sedentarius]